MLKEDLIGREVSFLLTTYSFKVGNTIVNILGVLFRDEVYFIIYNRRYAIKL